MGKQQEPSHTQAEKEVEATTPEQSASVAPEEEVASIEEESHADLVQKLNDAEQKAQENWDKMLRMQAEMENMKRRIQKDLESAHKFALERFAKDLLNVIDSLELGIQASAGTAPEIVKLREGSELTLKQFIDTLARFNIVAIDALGLPFNPELHQAVTTQPSAEVAPNTVLNVFQKGYLLNERLLRPAMVVVSKAAEVAAENLPKIDEQA